MRIVFASGESAPFVKTGGLADVVFGLGKALVNKKHKVMVFVPFYKKVKDIVDSGAIGEILMLFKVGEEPMLTSFIY